MNSEEQKKIEEIAKQLGTTVQKLLESNESPEKIIEKFNSGSLKILND